MLHQTGGAVALAQETPAAAWFQAQATRVRQAIIECTALDTNAGEFMVTVGANPTFNFQALPAVPVADAGLDADVIAAMGKGMPKICTSMFNKVIPA